MSLKKVTVYKVTLHGEVELQAVSGDEALQKARVHFLPLHESVAWTLEQKNVFIEQTGPTP